MIVEIIVLVVAVLLLLSSFRIVEQYEMGVVIRFGRAVSTRNPGLVLVVPLVDRVEKIDMQVQVAALEPQEVITKDSVSVGIQAVVYYQVVDPKLNYTKLDDDLEAITQLGQAIMRKIVGKHDLKEILEHSDTVSTAIQTELGNKAQEWGLEITSLELKDINLPGTMRRAMASVAEASREADAKVKTAEGEKRSAQELEDAAKIMSPQAMELRYYQTIREIGTDNASVVVMSRGGNGEVAAEAAAGDLGSRHIQPPAPAQA